MLETTVNATSTSEVVVTLRRNMIIKKVQKQESINTKSVKLHRDGMPKSMQKCRDDIKVKVNIHLILASFHTRL